MTVTNRAIGEQINLATVLNEKLEAPILQSEMGLDTLASATKQAVRWDEFSLKHNNDGTFKGIDQTDMNLTASATATKKPIRWDEFSLKHNNDGTFKTEVISSAELASGSVTQVKVKTKTAVTLADASATLTATQMIDNGIFTITPTAARTLTTDTAVNIVAGLVGYQVGTWFQFTIVNNATFDVTLASGTGVTIVGKSIANNTSITFIGRIDSATTVSIYRIGGSLDLSSINNSHISSSAAIVASKLAIQKMYKKTTSVISSSTTNTYGTQVDLTPATGYVAIIPRAIDIVFGGTFGSETVTVDVIVTFSDATTATVSKTATATGTTSLTSTELMTLAKDDVYINKLSLKSKSSIASTATTVSVNQFGYYL